MEGLWLALEQSAFGDLVRQSTWLYPAANVLHVLGVIGFFATVAVMDLALLRALPGGAAKAAVARFRPFAALLLAVIAATGLVLFTPEASALAANPALRAKLLLVLLGLANVAVNEAALRSAGPDSGTVRLTAGLSLLVWLGVAALGRTIAYV
ncbi:hypothetical protein [Aestuariivirga sp.]|uniref:hypothetical protein n=1 Tax=Aestuariivirga sp. TaxID=2650926 RepID=UPI003919A145